MPRRFALLLLLVLVFLLVALLLGRRLASPASRAGIGAVPTARPTSVVPPTPIPARRVAVYFESAADEKLHPEARDVPVSSDDVAFLRLVAGAVLEGPRRPDLLRPFPEGWSLRAAYRMKDGLVVLDLAPPPLAPDAPAPPPGSPRWGAGSHEEEASAQALAVTVAKNLPETTRLVLLVAGEPADTLGGHLDLSHPLHPDLARASDEAPLVPPPPTPTSAPTAVPTAAPPAPTAPPAAHPPTRPTRRPLTQST